MHKSKLHKPVVPYEDYRAQQALYGAPVYIFSQFERDVLRWERRRRRIVAVLWIALCIAVGIAAPLIVASLGGF